MDRSLFTEVDCPDASPGGRRLPLLSPLGPALIAGVCGFDLVVPSRVGRRFSGRCGHLRHDRLEEKARAAGSAAPEKDRLAYAGYVCLYCVPLQSNAAAYRQCADH